MYKVMFVCHGNICRSPMAEFIMKDLVKKWGREREFFISSSAVSTEEIWGGVGNPVYAPVKALLAKKGISCEGKRAKLLTYKDGETYDYLLCMDDSNVRKAKQIAQQNKDKCVKLLSFTGVDEDVADPWWTRDFEEAYEDIYRGVCAFIEFLDNQK